jgi:hypothetical protein
MSAERYEGYRQRAHNFAIDALTAEVAGAFDREGIETLVLKGPVLARWLYPGEVRLPTHVRELRLRTLRCASARTRTLA